MWIIDRDYDAERDSFQHNEGTNSNAVGIMGPSGCGNADEICVYPFRMLCDGEVIYEGRSDDNESEAAFGPLDDFGQPNYGCDTIEYLENGEWKPL